MVGGARRLPGKGTWVTLPFQWRQFIVGRKYSGANTRVDEQPGFCSSLALTPKLWAAGPSYLSRSTTGDLLFFLAQP